MNSGDIVYRHTFNTLAELLLYGNVINSHCFSREECERCLDTIKSIVETMAKQLDKMEN